MVVIPVGGMPWASGIALPQGVGLNFWFGDLEQPQILRSMRLFAEEVMPAFQ